MQCRLPRRSAVVLASLFLAFFSYGSAQGIDLDAVRPSVRVRQAIDERDTVALRGNTYPLARAEYDAGAVAGSYPMEKMILVLRPDAAQGQALEELLAAQQDPHSPQYHRWLTPDAFAEHFGAAPADIDAVANWLQSRGFSIDSLPTGGRSIIFTGTAAQVESAFHTQIHEYRVGASVHHANASDPRIPAALAGVVSGVATLYDFRRHSMLAGTRPVPEYTAGSTHYVAPEDFAAIYDVAALYSGGINGANQSIAVLGRTNINLSDVSTFRSMFGLPANNPTVILNGANPGILKSDEDEADLDVEWSGAVAPLASVKFVVSASTSSSDGIDLSAQYAVSNNVAPVITLSYGACEADMGTDREFYEGLWQQAAAQGITVFASAGDSGAAGCDSPTETRATGGASVSGLCSTPYEMCVGGTQFSEGAGSYWSTTNDAHYGSAQAYIPEVAWNESALDGGSDLWAGGGGASAYYGKPAWQTGPGVPADGRRDVPDVALGSGQHDGYLIYSGGQLMAAGGTSVAAPSFAGLMALVDQSASAPQGNAGPALYALAAAQDSSGVASFHDVTTGNNSVPGLTGFSAGTGYDLATGLGSVDAHALVTNWNTGGQGGGLGLSVTPGTLTIAKGTSGRVTAQVTVSGGYNSAVTLSVTGLPQGVTAAFSNPVLSAPGAGNSALTVAAGSKVSPGSWMLTITASGANQTKTASLSLQVGSAGTAASFTLSAPAQMTVTAGNSAQIQVSTAGSGSFNSALALSVSGLPAGVRASFAPAAIAAPGFGSSTLTVQASSSVRGSYALTVMATGGGITKTASLLLTVASSSSLSIVAAASSISLTPGSHGTVSLFVSASSGFNSPVALAASGLPAGLTAAFSPITLTTPYGSDLLTLSASAGLSGGTYPVTITASGGGKSSSVGIVVTVDSAAGFTMTASPASLNIAPGGTGTSRITLAAVGGFHGQVLVSAGSVPKGISLSYASVPGAASTLALTVRASSSAANGTWTLTVRGVSTTGSPSASANIAVTIGPSALHH